MISISENLRRIISAILAAVLNKESLEAALKKFEAILHDEKNFTGEKMLAFSPDGLNKLKQIPGENFNRDKDMVSALQTLHRSMELAAKTGDEEMAYVLKQFDKSPHSWTRLKLDGLDHFDTKHKIKESLEALNEMLHKPVPKNTITPEELQEMKDRGVMSRRQEP
jgi:hypothetical protein